MSDEPREEVKEEVIEEDIHEEVIDDDLSLPDIPMPTEQVESGIKDNFDTAFKYGFIGVGQGGSRICPRLCGLSSG